MIHEARVEQVTFLAGSVAYHAFVSLVPLLVLVLVLLSALGGLAPETVFALVAAAMTDGAADVLVTELQRASQSQELSVGGGGVLVWGTLRVFRGLDTAFSDVYDTEAANSFVDQIVDGLVVSVAFGVAVVVGGTLQAVIPGDSVGTLWLVANRLALFGGLVVTLFPVYYVFPDAGVSVREVVPGVVVAATGVTVFVSMFGLYVQWSGENPEASALAAVLLFLTWLYVSSLVVLLGAVVNAVLSNRSADVSVQPVFDGAPTPSGVASTPSADDLARVARATDADSLTLDGDESVTVPAPAAVRVDHDTGTAVGDDESVTQVTLAWGTGAETDDGRRRSVDIDGDPETATDTGEDLETATDTGDDWGSPTETTDESAVR